jgi:hypothetical protein
MNRNDRVKTPRLGNINYESTIPSTTTLLVTFNYDLTGLAETKVVSTEEFHYQRLSKAYWQRSSIG